MEKHACQVEKSVQHPWQYVPRHYLLSLQCLVDSEISVIVHTENDDFPGVVEPGCSRNINPLVLGGYDRGDGVTWKEGGHGVSTAERLPACSQLLPGDLFPISPQLLTQLWLPHRLGS